MQHDSHFLFIFCSEEFILNLSLVMDRELRLVHDARNILLIAQQF